ncbi:hypothetical protein K7711_37670 [Nocardia sp. CA2R105]|uniref:hypothetical protein n=1 Tax=Nocardia coffeae TaxID=2873381 RepID=UPI001CA60C1E|nr:hypothetical protein [Nocardia coffeae]MBY8862253.1 hypothetical protein [Nocardia coffeae]
MVQDVAALNLAATIEARYGSLDAFCARLRASVENPTAELLRYTGGWSGETGQATTGGRHRKKQ